MKKKISEDVQKLYDLYDREYSFSDYRKKGVSNAYETEGGLMVEFSRPTIKTSFCYGYGFCGVSTEEDRSSADGMCRAMHRKENFINANMEENFPRFNEMIIDPKVYEITDRRDNGVYNVEAKRGTYYGRECAEKELTPLDRRRIREILVEEKNKFMKRLETYWKRYGDSKLKTWSFLSD